LKLLGFDPTQTISFLSNIVPFLRERGQLKKQLSGSSEFPFGKLYPILNETKVSSGAMNGHYFHQDLFVAQLIFQNNPAKHVDIGSRTDGFVAHVASFRSIEVIDIREAESTVDNIVCKQFDLMNMPADLYNYTDSISCLHAIEHFGLGRYSDPIDAQGHLQGLDNMYNMLQKGGTFYFSTPIGRQRIEFNAHRVFAVKYLLSIFEGKYRIKNFAFVDDKGDIHKNVPLTGSQMENNYNCHYGCGIFEMEKL
jgi:hypothetical protein